MSIRGRLRAAFLFTLCLLALDVGIYLLAARARSRSLDRLREAMATQIVLNRVEQDLRMILVEVRALVHDPSPLDVPC
ncbi:MAG: hypothetical protein KatS3mg115_1276 [Candidatus Poribacteria bacterium]|nr:MAG: hypothetical protein KatS3mg115_1276 [Candidatus Poribacteria bacterium]